MTEAKTLSLTPTESVTVLSSTEDALVVEGSYSPGGDAPPKHFHPSQDEHFEVTAGQVSFRVDGAERRLGPGDEIDVPRGTVHQVWNETGEEARLRWTTSPRGRTEQWFEAVDRLNREAGGGRPGPLAFGVLMSEYNDSFRLALGPQVLMRPLVTALALGGRLKGHRT